MKPELLPPNIVRRIAEEDRRALGIKTTPELQAVINTKSERQLHRLILNDLLRRRSQGEHVWWVHSRMDKKTTTAKGVPDFLVLQRGYLIALECKVGGNVLTDEQLAERMKILMAGGYYNIIHTFDEYKNATKL